MKTLQPRKQFISPNMYHAFSPGADVVCHTAGPFQRATSHPWAMNVLEACIETKVRARSLHPLECAWVLFLPLSAYRESSNGHCNCHYTLRLLLISTASNSSRAFAINC